MPMPEDVGTLRVCARYGNLLLRGLLVDWVHSVAAILTIGGIVSTPLLLGSIRNKTYVALKQRAELENNAREITIFQDDDLTMPLDEKFLIDLRSRFPEYRILGNNVSTVTVRGPAGSDYATMHTLYLRDPRNPSLQIEQLPRTEFDLYDLVVSDDTGEVIYGEERWNESWSAQAGQLLEPVTVEFGSARLAGEFRVGGRRRLSGSAVYASEEATRQLEMAALGLGSKLFGLPPEEYLLQYALPQFRVARCLLALPQEQGCPGEAEARLLDRLRSLHLQVLDEFNRFPGLGERYRQIGIALTRADTGGGAAQSQEQKGDCEARLTTVVESLGGDCRDALIAADLEIDVTMENRRGSQAVTIRGLTDALYPQLPRIVELRDEWGGAGPAELFAMTRNPGTARFWLVAPDSSGATIGEDVSIHLPGETTVSALVAAFYHCPEEAAACPFLSDAVAVFRLHNIADGIVGLVAAESPYFELTKPRVDFDEVLFYARNLEEVPKLVKQLKTDLSQYVVDYNAGAINRVRRQNSRLSVLFNATVVVAVLFLFAALASMAVMNIQRRRRQIAQLMILGFSRVFVWFVLVSEYLLLSLLGSLLALTICAGFFEVTRCILRSPEEQGGARSALDSAGCKALSGLYQQVVDSGDVAAARGDFQTIVEAMTLDWSAFLQILFLALTCATCASGMCGFYLVSRVDPVELLE